MRTDVKVGLVCVLALVIAVVGYFALQGKSKDTTPASNARNHVTGAGDKVASGTSATGGATVAPPGEVGASNLDAPPVAYSPSPLGQVPTPYSPPTGSTTAPLTGSPMAPAGGATGGGPRPLLPAPGGDVPPLTNNGLTGGTGGGTPSIGGSPSLSGSTGGSTSGSTGGSIGGRTTDVEPGLRPRDPLQEPGTPRMPDPGYATGGAAGTYVVVSGDSLASIAKKNHVSLKAIEAANPTIAPPYTLKLKQVINLPAATASDSTATTQPGRTGSHAAAGRSAGAATRPATAVTRHHPATDGSPAAAGAGFYTVKAGDTLRNIAKATYGDEKQWRLIARANHAKLPDPNDLEVGMVLRIPPK